MDGKTLYQDMPSKTIIETLKDDIEGYHKYLLKNPKTPPYALTFLEQTNSGILELYDRFNFSPYHVHFRLAEKEITQKLKDDPNLEGVVIILGFKAKPELGKMLHINLTKELI